MAKRAQDAGAARRERPRPAKRKAKTRARAQRSTILLRWCAIGALGLVAFLYYRPLSTYIHTRSTLNERRAEVAELRGERARLQARLEQSTTIAALSREARRMSLVRPGEQLYVVKGIAEWRRAQRARAAGKATIGADG